MKLTGPFPVYFNGEKVGETSNHDVIKYTECDKTGFSELLTGDPVASHVPILKFKLSQVGKFFRALHQNAVRSLN